MTPLTTADIRGARGAHDDERPAAAHILTAAFRDGAVLAWAEPDPAARAALLEPYFTGLLAFAATHGSIRVAHADGVLAAVAIWFTYPLPAGVTDIHDLSDPDMPLTVATERLAQLEKALQARHPTAAHHYLVYLGVHPDAQNRGLGSLLLRERLATLHVTGTPAYLEANDRRNRALYLRLGFTDLGAQIALDDCPPVFPMWWSPADGPRPS